IPAAGRGGIETVRMPKDGKGAAELRRPVQQLHQLRLGALCGEAEVALLRERRVHRGEGHFDQVERLVAFEVPGPEGPRDAGAEAEGVGKAERRVVTDADVRERREISVWIDAQVVIAMAGDRSGERFELVLL